MPFFHKVLIDGWNFNDDILRAVGNALATQP
jgi:hypothetical protein